MHLPLSSRHDGSKNLLDPAYLPGARVGDTNLLLSDATTVRPFVVVVFTLVFAVLAVPHSFGSAGAPSWLGAAEDLVVEGVAELDLQRILLAQLLSEVAGVAPRGVGIGQRRRRPREGRAAAGVLLLLIRGRGPLVVVGAGCCRGGRRWAGKGSEGDIRRPACGLWGRNGGCWRTVWQQSNLPCRGGGGIEAGRRSGGEWGVERVKGLAGLALVVVSVSQYGTTESQCLETSWGWSSKDGAGNGAWGSHGHGNGLSGLRWT